MVRLVFALAGLAAVLTPATGAAQGKAQAAREVAEYLTAKFGRGAAAEGVEALGARLSGLVGRHGDDVLLAVRNTGPRGLELIAGAGEHTPAVVKLLARHGDDAVWVVSRPKSLAVFVKYGDDAGRALVRHGSLAESLVGSHGLPAAAALNAVSARQARRLVMMAEDGLLADAPGVFKAVAKSGDAAVDFLFRHRTRWRDAAILAVVLADVDDYLAGRRVLPPEPGR